MNYQHGHGGAIVPAQQGQIVQSNGQQQYPYISEQQAVQQMQAYLQQQSPGGGSNAQYITTQWVPGVETGAVKPYIPIPLIERPHDAWTMHPSNPDRIKYLPGETLRTLAKYPGQSFKHLLYGACSAFCIVCGVMGAIWIVGGGWNARTTVTGPGSSQYERALTGSRSQIQPARYAPNLLPVVDR